MHSPVRRRDAILSNFIFRKTLLGLLRKAPLFGVALLAMWLLTTLDRVRVTHGIANGRDGETSFEIGDPFLEHADKVDDTLKNWLNDTSRFKYHKFSNRRELLDALAAKARVIKDEDRAALISEQQEVMKGYEKAREDLGEEKRKLAKSRTRKRERIRQEQEIKDKEARIEAEKNAQLEKINTGMAALEPQLNERTKVVYTTFKKELPRILLQAENRKEGFFDDFFEDSLMEEKNSLHVIYQVFRISALIIVILSFVFILVMLFQQLPMVGGGDTVSEHLRSLISMKSSSGVGGEIAKTAIVSVTALGLGTAVLVGTSTLSVTPPVYPPSIHDGGPRVRETFLPPIDVSWDPVSKEYLLQTFISNSGSNSSFWQKIFNGSQEPKEQPILNKIEVPPAMVIHTRIADEAGTRAILEELKALVAKLQPAPGVDDLRARLNSIEAQLKNLLTPGCQCAEALSTIAGHLQLITKSLGGSVSDQTITLSRPNVPTLVLGPLPAPSPSLIPSPSPTPSSPATPSPTPPNTDTVIGALKSTAAALDAIDKELKAIRADALVNRASNGGNGWTRAGRFFGSEFYVITEQVFQALDEVMKGNANHAAFKEALEKMKVKAPQEKDEFLRTLRTFLTENVSRDQKKSLLKSLKPWEHVILSYARMRK